MQPLVDYVVKMMEEAASKGTLTEASHHLISEITTETATEVAAEAAAELSAQAAERK